MSDKKNQSNITGNSNIVIQDVNANNLTLNVNGKEIKLEVAMNQWLVTQIMPKIAKYNPLAEKFIKAVSNIKDWEQQQKYRNAALIILQSSYIGVVGIFMKKLSAIGNESFSTDKLKENIKNSYFLSLRLLDLSNIILISELWDFSEKNKITIRKEDKKLVAEFFNQNVERDINFSFQLLKSLYQTIKQNQIKFFLSEMADLEPENNSSLTFAFAKMEEIYTKIGNQDANGEDSFWVEKSLADILSSFNFLAKYKIQAVKEVDYHHIRSLEEYFIHKLSFYGLSNKRTEQENHTSENINFATKGIYTDSVIVYEKDYFNGINLFPFVIDYNNVLMEEGTNLSVFSHKELSDEKMLNYISIADNEFIGIQAENSQLNNDLNKVYSDKETIIQHKKNILLQLINNVKTAILDEEDESAEDFLDNLLG